jgi:hypothetical protein
MKSFDPMNSGDDSDFVGQLRGIELRRPPEEWKGILLPKPVPPLFPKPLLIGLGVCWAATAGLYLTQPEDELKDQPLILPPGQMAPGQPGGDSSLLGFNEPER